MIAWRPKIGWLSGAMNYHGPRSETLTSTVRAWQLGGTMRPRRVIGCRVLLYRRSGRFVGMDFYLYRPARG